MKGLATIGGVKCLFGITAITDFCESEGIDFSDFEKHIAGEGLNYTEQIKRLSKFAHAAAQVHADYEGVEYKGTPRSMQVRMDAEGLEESVTAIVEATFAGLGKLSQEKKS